MYVLIFRLPEMRLTFGVLIRMNIVLGGISRGPPKNEMFMASQLLTKRY